MPEHVPDSPDELSLVVMNPDAVGNPDEDPKVFVGADLRAWFAPCDGAAPSRDGYCGGVNGFHAEDCPRAKGSHRCDNCDGIDPDSCINSDSKGSRPDA